MRGQFSSVARRLWARVKPPRQGSMNRRVETIRPPLQGAAPRLARPALGDRLRAWNWAISQSLLRTEAARWPARRKLQQGRRPGTPLLTISRNSAEPPAPSATHSTLFCLLLSFCVRHVDSGLAGACRDRLRLKKGLRRRRCGRLLLPLLAREGDVLPASKPCASSALRATVTLIVASTSGCNE